MIQAKVLTHYYGPYPAIQDVNFGVRRGEILGVLGPNGAGKTTTMRIIASLDHPTFGTAELGGVNVVNHPAEARRILDTL